VRIGDWKGVKAQNRWSPDDKWQVYNLAEDEAEITDVADEHPELIEKFEEIVKKRTPSHIEEWNF